MVESDVTEGGKNPSSFFFRENETTQTTTNMTPQAQSYPRGETAASGGKRCR